MLLLGLLLEIDRDELLAPLSLSFVSTKLLTAQSELCFVEFRFILEKYQSSLEFVASFAATILNSDSLS